jgi:hypothetical protein
MQDMGVTVQQCAVYLSEYQDSALLTVASADVCNPCLGGEQADSNSSKHTLQLVLVGSLYGIPYGATIVNINFVMW